jgi:hypothetical protein
MKKLYFIVVMFIIATFFIIEDRKECNNVNKNISSDIKAIYLSYIELEKYMKLGGKEKFEEFKQQLIHEFNTLFHVEGLPKIENLNVLSGSFVNLEYRLPNGQIVKFLDDNATYLGSQLECEFGGDRCFGIVANMDFLLVCTYEENGENPELVIYKKR